MVKKKHIPLIIIFGTIVIIGGYIVFWSSSCEKVDNMSFEIDVGNVIKATSNKKCNLLPVSHSIDQKIIDDIISSKVSYLKALVLADKTKQSIDKIQNEISNLSQDYTYDNSWKNTTISDLQNKIKQLTSELDTTNLDVANKKKTLDEKLSSITVAASTEEEKNSILSEITKINYVPDVELDQGTYTWTDRVYITIIDPASNLDPNEIDTIGGTKEKKITISTNRGTIENYMLAETGVDTGIFTGYIILTGFVPYDPLGDGKMQHVYGQTSERGLLTSGMLSAGPGDELDIKYFFIGGQFVTTSANIDWNLGEIHFRNNPKINDKLDILLVDPDLNLNPREIDKAPIMVISSSDAHGLKIYLNESGESTGMFQGSIFLSSKPNSTDTLLVKQGDNITATYIDRTLPKSYNSDTEEVTSIDHIP